MPPRRQNASSVKPPTVVSAEEKIARLLALLLIKDLEQKNEQVALLRNVGFEVSEVALLLGMTENHVNVAAHHGRKKLGKKKPVR
jgi:DNA-directed RNA polymerase specialized sigma24 family protein